MYNICQRAHTILSLSLCSYMYTHLPQNSEQGILNYSMLEIVEVMNDLLCLFNLFSYAVNIRVLHRETLIEKRDKIN